MNKIPEKLGSEYYRQFLTHQGQAFYDCINAQLLRKEYIGKINVSISDFETSVSDCFAAYKAIRDDHPEYFYLGFQSEFTHYGQTGTLTYPILYSPDIIERIQQQMRKSIYRLVCGTAHLQTMDKQILVYERIAKKLSYVNHGDIRDHNIVGPILLSSGVCEGHNALLILCFRRIGIPCIKVYGKIKKNSWHCWTIAWINGTPVHCDVTWDGAEEGIVYFNYLNLSDVQISRDHYDFKSKKIPSCVSETMNYYNYHDLCVSSFNGLRKRLRANLSGGMDHVLVHFRYIPPAGDYLKEMKRALVAEQINGKHRLYFYPSQQNMAVMKI